MVLTTPNSKQMNETLKIGIEAVNRWLFHGWNYEMTTVEIPDYSTNSTKQIHVPEFLVGAKWTCNLPHMISKWGDACRDNRPDAYLVRFYASLDGPNRIALLEWVLENYTDEQKLF